MLNIDVPLSKASSAASSSMCASMISASLWRYLARTGPGAFRPHTVSNAFCAALTATSTSFGVASAIFVIIFPSAVKDSDQFKPCDISVKCDNVQGFTILSRLIARFSFNPQTDESDLLTRWYYRLNHPGIDRWCRYRYEKMIFPWKIRCWTRKWKKEAWLNRWWLLSY